MTPQIENLHDRENLLVQEIDEAIERAGHMMNMDDLPEGQDEGVYNDLYDERYHCGVCSVREVMEVVWPAVDAYIKFLKEDQPRASAQDVAVASLAFFTDPNETAFAQLSAALDVFVKDV